jgi:molybdopterin molybdotransferase
MLTVAEALAAVLANATPLEVETVGLNRATGRTLAEPVLALRTQPPAAVSAMDGYAVRAVDAKFGARLAVIGAAPAGRPFEGTVNPGEACRIFTGAVVPKGADAVLIQENATATNLTIQVQEASHRGDNIRPAGIDFQTGTSLIAAGTLLTPRHIALAAAANHAELTVYRKPVIAIIATGDELREPGSELEPGQIIASNSYAVAAMAHQHGARVLDMGIVPDDKVAIAASIRVALRDGADVIVTLGGASVGDHDLVQGVFKDEGVALDFWKIAMRPGKPLMFGNLGDTKILGLPGNPVSAYVCAQLFLLPLIAALQGRVFKQNIRKAILANALPANGPREHYARGRMIGETDDGFPIVETFMDQDSSLLVPLAASDCLVVQAAGDGGTENGGIVRLVLFG